MFPHPRDKGDDPLLVLVVLHIDLLNLVVPKIIRVDVVGKCSEVGDHEIAVDLTVCHEDVACEERVGLDDISRRIHIVADIVAVIDKGDRNELVNLHTDPRLAHFHSVVVAVAFSGSDERILLHNPFDFIKIHELHLSSHRVDFRLIEHLHDRCGIDKGIVILLIDDDRHLSTLFFRIGRFHSEESVDDVCHHRQEEQ